MKTKFVRLLATGAIALAVGLTATVGIAVAQSVPLQQPATNAPVQPAQPPQSPIEPSNAGNVGGAGAGPSLLPSAGSAGDNGSESATSWAVGALAVILAAGGAASWRLGRRVR